MSYFTTVSQILAQEKLESYRPTPHGTDEGCLCRYLWNIALCEALSPMLHLLEVVYRNAVHASFVNRFYRPLAGTDDWLLANNAVLDVPEQEYVTSTKQRLAKQPHPLTEELLVTELSLGFWTSLLDTRYRHKWPLALKDVFPHATRAERDLGDIRRRMNRIRELRNASAHRKSIWHWRDLPQVHADMYIVLSWIAPELIPMAKVLDRFFQVHAQGLGAFATQVESLASATATSAATAASSPTH